MMAWGLSPSPVLSALLLSGGKALRLVPGPCTCWGRVVGPPLVTLPGSPLPWAGLAHVAVRRPQAQLPDLSVVISLGLCGFSPCLSH